MGRKLRSLSIGLILTFLTFFCMEITIRRILPIPEYLLGGEFRTTPFIIMQSDYLPVTLPVNTTVTAPGVGKLTINKFGYRGSDPSDLKKDNSIRRILFLGDSFTLGWGINEPEIFVERIKQTLKNFDPNVETINAAYHAGYSPDSYYAYLQKEGFQLEPDLVLITLFAGNDIDDIASNVWRETDTSGAPLSINTIRIYPDYTGKLLNTEMLPITYRLPFINRSHLVIGLTNLGYPSLKKGLISEGLSDTKAWNRFETVTEATIRSCKSRNIPLIYLVLPAITSENEVAHVTESQITKSMEMFLQKQGVPYISASNFVKDQHLLPNDGHLNSSGHRIIADHILEELLNYFPIEF